MIAAGSFVAGVVREVGQWPPAALRRLRSDIPVIRRFTPIRHTSRRGWLANVGCYAESPFACDIDTASWITTRGTMSLRTIARRVFHRFARPIAAVADRPALSVIRAILNQRGATLLSLDDRPASYDDVGGGARHAAFESRLPRSRYERIVRNAVQRRPLRLGGDVSTLTRCAAGRGSCFDGNTTAPRSSSRSTPSSIGSPSGRGIEKTS